MNSAGSSGPLAPGGPLTQIRVGDLDHAALGFVAHLLHRGLGGQPAAHRLGDAPQPAAIGREHAVGLDDVAVLAGSEAAALVHERVDRLLHRRDRAVEAPQLGVDVLGDDLADHDPRLVQHRRGDRQTRVETDAVEPHRQRGADQAFRHLMRIDQLAAGDQLGDDHRDRLQDLDVVLGVLARRAVLHGEHAERASAAQDRHPHQGVVDLFAGFGAVREIRVRLGVGQRQRPGVRRDRTDQPLADPEPCAMHRLGAQPLGREQLQHLAGAHHVSRAHLGDHLGGDHPDDAVEPFLRAARPGHDRAQPAQEAARRRGVPARAPA
jgi:hypothetical protein